MVQEGRQDGKDSCRMIRQWPGWPRPKFGFCTCAVCAVGDFNRPSLDGFDFKAPCHGHILSSGAGWPDHGPHSQRHHSPSQWANHTTREALSLGGSQTSVSFTNLSEHCENVLRKFPLESKKYIAREAYFTIYVHQEHTEDSSFCGYSCAYNTVIRS